MSQHIQIYKSDSKVTTIQTLKKMIIAWTVKEGKKGRVKLYETRDFTSFYKLSLMNLSSKAVSFFVHLHHLHGM